MSLTALTNDCLTVKLNDSFLKHSFLLKKIRKFINSKNTPIKLEINSKTLERIKDLTKLTDLTVKKNYLDCEIIFDKSVILYLQGLENKILSSLIEGVDYLDMPVLLEYCAYVVCDRFKSVQTRKLVDIFCKKEDKFRKIYYEKIKLRKMFK